MNEEWWLHRRLGPAPHVPPWSWLYLFPMKWREGMRPKLCSWCKTMTVPLGPEKYLGRPWACTVCDVPSRRISNPVWRSFDAAPPPPEEPPS